MCGCCTFCGLTHTTWRSGQWISESPIDHHHFWIVPCSTICFLWLAKVKPLPSSRNGCLRLCPRHNRRSKPPEPKRSDPNGTSRLFSRSLTSKKNAIRTLPPLCGSNLHRATNATPASGPPSAPPSRPPSAPPPAKLTPDLSLREFRAWRATWTDFFELSDGQRLSPDRQLALFRTCLSSEMRTALWPHHPDEDYFKRAAGRNRRALPPPAERRPLPGSVRTAPATSR